MIDRIGIVIATWNQTDMTLECLAALAAAGAALADTWVVDNGSQPEALPRIRERFPAVQTLRLAKNLGFAGGCNAGARAALSAGVDAILLLNNDALVEPATIGLLRAALIDDDRLAAVSPKVYYHNTPRIIQAVGIRVDPNSGHALVLGANQPDCGQYDQPVEPDALFGCVMLIRRQAWEQVGAFWEPFFNYAEEVDWCLRARRLGWRLRYIPRALAWHRTSSSLGVVSPLKVYLITRNRLYLRRRHQRGGWPGRRGLAYALYWEGRAWLRYLRLGHRRQAQAVVLALWDFWRGRAGNTRAPDLRRRAGG
jgi:GT2 family glycosyltransferase